MYFFFFSLIWLISYLTKDIYWPILTCFSCINIHHICMFTMQFIYTNWPFFNLTTLLYLCLTWMSSAWIPFTLSSIRVVVTVEQTEEEIEKAASCIQKAALAILKWLQMSPAWRQTLKSTITHLSSCRLSLILCFMVL